MVGRHLSAPFFLSVMLISYSVYDYLNKKEIELIKIRKITVFACCVLLFTSSLYPVSPITSKIKYENSKSNVRVNLYERPMDERKYYYNDAGLSYYVANSIINGYNPNRAIFSLGRSGKYLDENFVYVEGSIGFISYFAPDKTAFIDYLALSDALLSRIPAAPNQRIGHNIRPIPSGYLLSVEKGVNMVENPYLKQYYDKVLIITQGKLFTRKRFETIINMTLGKYDYLMDNYMKSTEYINYLEQVNPQK